MAIDLADVMDGLATRLGTITGLRVYAYPADTVSPPAAVVDLPEPLDYDATMGRGTDRATIPVHVVVSRVSDRSARNALAAYMAGSGASSVKAAIEGDGTLGGAADSTRVTSSTGARIAFGDVSYAGATFTCDVVG